jgi:CMP-N,N'-diacetyllegionaminic acid synthase
MKSIVALIPARSGSKRVTNKNVKTLGGHPLMAHTISTALQSEIFSEVIVSTDSEQYADVARHYGARVPFLRPSEIAGDVSPDIEWVEHCLKRMQTMGQTFDCFSILRPTSPFRTPQTIRRAWGAFLDETNADSLRAIEKCSQHPAKMWIVSDKRMKPVMEGENSGVPWHSNQYQALPEVYVQNASLEIAWERVVFENHSIAGEEIIPFITKGYEGFDINRNYDWKLAEELIDKGKAFLPAINKEAY